MGRLVVLSPHFDDAVLSAGQLIEGHHSPVVVTGCSVDGTELTGYDEKCGFVAAEDVIPTRRLENEKACRILGAEYQELGLTDDAYGGSDHDYWRLHVKRALQSLDWKDDMVVAPLATDHPDHAKMMDAAIKVCAKLGLSLYLYEELPHRVLRPERVETMRGALEANGIELELTFIGDGWMEMKRAAVACYRSQLWSLDLNCVFVPERFHKVNYV